MLVDPKIHTVEVLKHGGEPYLKVNTKADGSGISTRVLNDALLRLAGCWVVRTVADNLPMRMLVATKYRMPDLHIKHLERGLARGGDPLVLHVSRAQPNAVYNGFVLSLLVPELGDRVVFDSVTSMVRRAFTFQV